MASSSNNNASVDAQAQAMQMIGDLEIEMMTDMYQRMSKCCRDKCLDTRYSEPGLTKGEAVCMDRCVAKYLQLHDRLGKGLTEMSQQEDKTMQEHQQNMVAAAQKLHNK